MKLGFKLLGSIIIIFATTLIGISFSLKEKYRKEDLIHLERILKLMEHEIGYFKIPFEDVCIQIGKKDGNIVEKIIHMVGEKIEDRDEKTIGDIWNICWIEYKNQSYFTKNDIEEFLSFSKTLNNITTENEKSNFNFLIEYIKEQQKIIDRHLRENGKLYYSMGILSGVFVVITLI